jgi:hypothetical protein
MSEMNQFKPPKTPRKKAPVKRVELSPDAKEAYEALAKERDNRELTYGRHLNLSDNKRR